VSYTCKYILFKLSKIHYRAWL